MHATYLKLPLFRSPGDPQYTVTSFTLLFSAKTIGIETGTFQIISLFHMLLKVNLQTAASH